MLLKFAHKQLQKKFSIFHSATLSQFADAATELVAGGIYYLLTVLLLVFLLICNIGGSRNNASKIQKIVLASERDLLYF